MAATKRILTLGEGDFSFSLFLLQEDTSQPIHLTATSFDSADEIHAKFADEGVRIVAKIRALGALVLHGIDATNLSSYPDLAAHRYDQIIFHHPHCGVESAARHRALLAHLFRSAGGLLARPDGCVTVSLAGGQAERWKVLEQAGFASLVLVTTEPLRSRFTWRRHQGRSFRHIHRGNQSISQSSVSFTFAAASSTTRKPIVWDPEVDNRDESPTTFACALCGKEYGTDQGLRTHLRHTHSGIENPVSDPVSCPQCQRLFVSEAALRSHELAKHGPDPDIKPDWYQGAEREGDGGEPIVSCVICHQEFTRIDRFHQHLADLQPSAPLSLACTHCQSKFTSHHSLRQHRLHCNPPPS